MEIQKSRMSPGARGVTCIVLFLLINPSVALIMRSGFYRWLETVSNADEVMDIYYSAYLYLRTTILADRDYEPGVIATFRFTLQSGVTIVTRLGLWNFDTCNLGKGGEVGNPIYPMNGDQLRQIMFQWLLSSYRDLLVHYQGYGFMIHERVSLDFYPDTSTLSQQPSDNTPSHHSRDSMATSISDVDLKSREHLAAQHASNLQSRDLDGRGQDLRMHSNSSMNVNSTSFFTNFTRSVFQVGGNLTSQWFSNATNGTGFGHRFFPIDPYGDCDLPSLVLMTSLGPEVDDLQTHGLQILNPTEKIWSPNGRFYLVMQLDCNLVLYDVTANEALWASGTDGQGSVCYASITIYGELIIYDTDKTYVLWNSDTWCSTDSGSWCWTDTILQVQNDGNVVLYIFETGYVLFATDTVQCPGGCLESG